MKKTIKFFLATVFVAVVLCAFSLCVSAESGTCGENLTWDLTDGVLTISGTGEMTNWSESSNPPWYELRSSINSVKIEDGVTTVGVYAFSGCTEVTDVSISNSVTVIRGHAFADCVKLNDITIPDNVTKLYAYVFENCTGLSNVTIPDSVTQINSGVFKGCSNLQKLTIPFIGSSREASGTEYSVLGHIFGYSTSSSAGTTYQGISNRYYYIPASLKEVVVTDATQIPYGAFYNCNMITSITIPEGVTSIGSSAFYNCTGLTELTIPDSVTYIGGGPFQKCNSLEKITLPFIGSSRNEDENPLGYIFGCSASSSQATYIPTNLKEVVITDDTRISDRGFANCDMLESITLSEGLKTIGKSAFNKCTGLTSITLPEGLKTIGDEAFYNCTGLTSITLPEGLKTIGNSAFSKCTGLTSITLPEGLESIDTYAFRNCPGSIEFVIPNSVTYIGEGAFHGWNNLEKITLPFIGASRTAYGYIREYAVLGHIFGYSTSYSAGTTDQCVSNRYSYIPASLKEVVVTDATRISYHAFYNCTGLTSITLPETLSGIESWAFYNCTGLTSITIPKSLGEIGDMVFYGCSVLTDVHYNGTKAEWKKITKGSNNTSLTNATLHCITPPELDINLLRSFAYNYDSEAQTIAINAYDSEKTAGFGVSAEGISYRKIATDSGNGVSATVVDGVRHFVVKQANGANQSFNIYVEDNNGKKHKYTVTIDFVAEDTLAIKDIATLRCYKVTFSEKDKTIFVDVDRNDVLAKLGSIGVSIVAPEGVTVSYEYLSDNGGEDSTSGFTETKTDKYTLLSDGINNETGGGSLGKIAMKIFKKSNGTRMNVKVTLSDGVISTEYAMQIRISDVSVEDYVDIMDVKPLRADPDSFVVDNELKEIYFETLPGVSSAGFAVSVDNGLTKATRHRRLLTAQSGKSLAHGDIKDATEADIYDRYVVARRSVGKTQNFRVKVAGGEDGRAYTWYTVTVVFK